VLFERAARETWANTEGDQLQKGWTFKVGEGRTLERLCSRVVSLLQKSVGGVGLREACALHFTRSRERTGTGV
jgi:hypothetical protein